VQILSSTAAPEGSIVDKWTQSLGVEECAHATNGNAAEWSTNNHKSDAADGEWTRMQINSALFAARVELKRKKLDEKVISCLTIPLTKFFSLLQPPNAYIAGVPASNHYNPYYPGQLVPTILGPDPSSVSQAQVSPQMTQCVPQAVPMPQQQKHHPQHSDRIEVSRD
jgi:hypothetical protein